MLRVWCLTACCASICVAGAGAEQPWWDDFPIIAETGNAATAEEHGATVGMCASDNDPGWGTYGQMITRVPDIRTAFEAAGMKTISYYETFGQSYCFVAEIGPKDGADYAPVLHHHWGWQAYSGGEIQWIGTQNFFDDESFARPYTRTHPTFGGPAVTYPDGTVATGYDGPATDPRNSRVFDAACSKDIYGDLTYETYYNDAVNAIDPDTGLPVGPLDGLVEVGGRYAGLFMFHKDSACPMWIEYAYASARLAASHGLDGMWSDNYSPWDSFGYPPVQHAFGDWSVAGFRDYLAAHFTTDELAAMGVDDATVFDVRAYLRAKAVEWGGSDSPSTNPVWVDGRWLSDPIWLAFMIYKRQRGTQALDEYYQAVKDGARDGGTTEFLVAGNDIPFYSLGWCRGELDVVSTEMSAGWHMGAGSRGIMLPPEGRFAPVYRLAREHAKSRLANIWFYVPGGYEGRPGIADVLEYEMLANEALPMFHPDIPAVAGSPESNGAFGAFVEEVRDVFAGRAPAYDIGIYYSSSAELTQLTPGGFRRFDRQPHKFGVWGMGTMLHELHYAYRMVPEWKLTPETLSSLHTLIIPNADVFDPEVVSSVLQPWLDAGGRLIVTGQGGMRLPESGHFALNPDGPCLDGLSGSVLYTPANVGMDFYNSTDQRPALLADWAAQMEAFLGEQPLLVEDGGAVPATVGLSPYSNEALRRWYIDANNYAIDLASDTLSPTPELAFRVNLPDWMVNSTVRVLSPDGPVQATWDGSEVRLGSFTRYASVMLEADTDADGLTDADEITGAWGHVTDPDDADSDDDGLTDGSEVQTYGTHPLEPDTDHDGIADGDEVLAGSDPTDPADPAGVPATSVLMWVLGAAVLSIAGALAAARVARRACP